MLRRTRGSRTAPDGGLRDHGWPVLGRLLASLLVLGAVYLGVCWYAGRSIPPGSQVAGVSVGGLTQDEAAQRIDAQLDRIRRTPVKVNLLDGAKRVEPAALGLAVDARASVAGLTAFSLDPLVVWNRLTTGVQRQGVVTVDTAAADRTLQAWAAEFERPAAEGTVTFENGQVQATPPRDGRRLDVPATRTAIAAAWPPGTDVTDVAAVLTTTAPGVPRDRFEAAVDQVAKPAMSAPLKVRSGQAEAELTPSQFGPALRMEAGGGNLVLRVDEQRFLDAARQAVPGLETDATNARVTLIPGQPPRVEPGVTGWRVQRGQVADVVRAALTSPERTASLPVETVTPELSTEQVTSWGIGTPMARADLPGGADVAAPLDGVLLAPNATFSWPVPAAAPRDDQAAGSDAVALVEAVRQAASAAGLTVSGDPGAGSLTLTNPGQGGVLLQVDRSGDPARFVVWGRASGV